LNGVQEAESSNLSTQTISNALPHCRGLELAPLAQLDRVLDYESRGQEFKSLKARHKTADMLHLSAVFVMHRLKQICLS
jgi:hypothetical protein